MPALWHGKSASTDSASEGNSQFVIEGLPAGGNAFSGRIGATLLTDLGGFSLEYRLRKSPDQTRQSVEFRVRFK